MSQRTPKTEFIMVRTGRELKRVIDGIAKRESRAVSTVARMLIEEALSSRQSKQQAAD